MYTHYRWNDKLKRVQGITCPGHLRLSEGPDFIVIGKPWKDTQKFYKIYDILTHTTYYRTTLEAYVLMAVSRSKFYRFMKRHFDALIKNRYTVQKIPKILFTKKTNRKYEETYVYRQKY